MSDRIPAIKAMLENEGLDAVVFTSPTGRFYSTGFSSSAGMSVVTRKAGYFFVDFRYIEAARSSIAGYNVVMTTSDKGYNTLINEVIEKDGVKRLGFEDGEMSHAAFLKNSENWHAELIPAQPAIDALRHKKEFWEIERLIKAQRLTESVFEDILNFIKPGVTEREVAAELVYGMLNRGAQGTSFDPIVVSGPNSSKPHGVPGARRIEAGDFVTLDFGCLLDGYCSDMTRTVAVGHATDEMKKIYDIVLRAQFAGIAAAKVGVPGKDIDAAARAVIESEGYGEYFGHGFGHGLGIEIHEAPNANQAEERPLPAGAVISAEPGIYLPGRFGVRIEDIIIITENGCDNITKAPKELLIL